MSINSRYELQITNIEAITSQTNVLKQKLFEVNAYNGLGSKNVIYAH